MADGAVVMDAGCDCGPTAREQLPRAAGDLPGTAEVIAMRGLGTPMSSQSAISALRPEPTKDSACQRILAPHRAVPGGDRGGPMRHPPPAPWTALDHAVNRMAAEARSDGALQFRSVDSRWGD